ncbi:MAG: hypothetical protein ACTHMZ_10445 [Actinomycetes bacterium]
MTARRVTIVLLVVLAFYLVTVGWRGVLLVEQGSVAGVLLGLGVIGLPLIAAWFIGLEVRFGASTERLARQLEADGQLPVDDLPRDERGRIDRAAADEAFAVVQQQVESDPVDWRHWFHLATAYDAAGDRPRARQAMRRAIALERAGGRSSS